LSVDHADVGAPWWKTARYSFGEVAPTRRRFEWVDEVSIFRFRDGKIAHAWSLEDTLGRLQQLGLV
jgi:hypothetical protein